MGSGRGLLLCLLLGTLTLTAGARKKPKEPEPLCRVSVRVLREGDGRPIRNAGVVLRSLHRDGSPDADVYELKTNSEGRAVMADLPCGGLRVQVIAHRMQTFGGDFQIRPDGGEIVVRLNPPAGQRSADQ